jgi:hypothetical protein
MTDPVDAAPPMSDGGHAVPGLHGGYRQAISERLELVCVHADLGIRYASIGDDTGLTYALRCLAAYLRTTISIHADLQASKSQETRS